MIKKTAPLHDIGKVGLRDSVILKDGPYVTADWEAMKQHTKIGSRLLSDSRAPLLMMAREIALTHHERWDGTGYHGIKDVQIPLAARIVALADAFDIMTHPCSYKATMTLSEAKGEIAAQAGKQFDPELSALFMQLIDREGGKLLAATGPLQMVA